MSLEQFKLRPLLAEMIATFGLVYIGGMAVLQYELPNSGMNLVGVALAHALILSFMVYFSAKISGGHVNPAITIGFVATGKMDAVEGVLYILSQLIGSIIAGLLILASAGEPLLSAAAGGSELGYPQLNSGFTFFQGMLIEFILTFFLVFMVWATMVDNRVPESLYGFAIGGTYGIGIFAAYIATGAAMNPARVFGPALLKLDFASHLIYWIGPILGALLAAFVYKYVFLEDNE